MTKEQIRQYKKNHIDNKELEFICKYAKSPSIATVVIWGKEADQKIRQMKYDIELFRIRV